MFDWVEVSDGRFIIIRKNIGPGWTKIAECRKRAFAEQLAMLLNKGLTR